MTSLLNSRCQKNDASRELAGLVSDYAQTATGAYCTRYAGLDSEIEFALNLRWAGLRSDSASDRIAIYQTANTPIEFQNIPIDQRTPRLIHSRNRIFIRISRW